MPAHTNPAGDIFGGWIMASMNAAAVMTTTRLVGGRAVTVAVSFSPPQITEHSAIIRRSCR
jgi:acyl-CoA thioesterase YciA